MADFYTWAATGSGDWSTASNWFDVIPGTLATVAPGSADDAEIDSPGTAAITVTGPADVAGLSVSGQVTLAGSYDVGGAFELAGLRYSSTYFTSSSSSTIVLAGDFAIDWLSIGDLFYNNGFFSTPVTTSGLVEVGSGAMVSAGSIGLFAGDLQVDGGAVSVAGTLTLGEDYSPEPSGSGFALAGGSLDVTNHGSVRVGDLAIIDGGVNLDATSTPEIGDAGTAAAGTITIDPGAVLTEGDANSYSNGDILAAETADIAAPILNNGTITSDKNLSSVINNGTIIASDEVMSSISGNGLVEIDSGDTIGPGDSGTFDVEFSGTLVVGLGSGVPIDTADTPTIANFGTVVPPGAIVLQGISADTATYTVTGPGIGTLALDDGTTQVASLTLQGNYDGNAFVVVPDGGDSIVTLNTVGVGASYSWVATGSGDWSTTSNWFDVTTGTLAAFAPGPEEMAEIENTGTGAITVSGPGDALDLSVSGDVTLAGDFNVGSLSLAIPPGSVGLGSPSLTESAPTFTSTIALAGTFDVNSLTIGFSTLVYPFNTQNVYDIGTVEIDQGSMLSAGSVLLNAGDLVVDGGSVDISGALTVGTFFVSEGGFFLTPVASGTLDVTDHASFSTENLFVSNGDVNLDATSTLEVGGQGTAAAGTITVDPDALLELNPSGTLTAGGDAIAPPILNNGTIIAQRDLSNTINNGTIYIGDETGGDVTISSISGDGQIDFFGNGSFFLGNSTIGAGVSGTLNFDSFRIEAITIALGTGVPIDGTDTPQIANFNADLGGGTNGISDSIILQGVSADTATYTATGVGIGTLTLDDGTTPVASLTMLGTYASDAFSVTPGDGDSTATLTVPCFAAGTRIATPNGEVPVEALSTGDAVTLAAGGVAPIVWIGHRRVDCRSHPTPHDVWPVRVRRGAFASGVPHRDLVLSPDHAVFADGVLIPIKYLMNGDTIRQVECATIKYFHIELASHDILLADGLPVESYLDTGDRAGFENGGRVVSLFPVFSAFAWDAYGCAPLVVTGPPVEAVRQRIDLRVRRQRRRRVS